MTKETTIREKHVDAMLFWGIIFVVMGHKYQIPHFFFPAYSFHVGLFFFISGYLFKIRKTFREKLRFITKKTINQLFPYFIFNLLFFILNYFLKKSEISLSLDLNFHNFFIEPFYTGEQNQFLIPCWFLINLYVINLIMQLIYIKDCKLYKWLLLGIITIIALYFIPTGFHNLPGYKLLITRTSIALVFFQIGIMVKTYKQIFDKLILNPIIIAILWLTVIFLANFYTNPQDNLSYLLIYGNIKTPLFLITTLLIIFISYSICFYISQNIKENNLILKIGQNSFWIMALHLLIFFIINSLLYQLGFITKDNLNNIYYSFKIDYTFLLYLVPAIFIPTLFGLLIKKLRHTALQ